MRRGVILAGGNGTRLLPMTKSINKHLLPVGNQPMIYWPIQTLISMGITEILIVTGGNNVGNFMYQLGNGNELGVNIMYAVQEEANGIAGALKEAKMFLDKEDQFAVILGDNIFIESNTSELADVCIRNKTAGIMVECVKDPSRFGVIEYDEDNNPIEIIEKPFGFISHDAVTGLYIYDSNVFGYIDKISPSLRGELEITDINNFYLKSGKMSIVHNEGFWTDAGTLETYASANAIISRVEINKK